jgi:hypothetical protein
MNLTITHSLVKIVGVFAYNHQKDIPLFTKSGYVGLNLVDLPAIIIDKGSDQIKKAKEATEANYKNTYYSEFRDFMFTGKEQSQIDGYQKSQIRTFYRKKHLSGNFEQKKYDSSIGDMVDISPIPFSSNCQELFLFPGGIGMFALILDTTDKSLHYISDLINKARAFESKLDSPNKSVEFQKWISNEVLCGLELTGKDIELDEFSGSKFKVFTVIDMPEASNNNQYNREHLLYELGTSSPLGIVGTSHRLSPSASYYNDLINNKISAFQNYECLALLDSFTVIGDGNYTSLQDNSEVYVPHHQWNRVYFGIYLYNLFVRYSLFKFNAKFLTNPVKYRDDFQNFLNFYNFKHISFNFLPNLLFDKIRNSLHIEEEIITFEKRLGSLATSIQEQQEKRQAFLLTLISVVSSFEAVDTINAWLDKTQVGLGLSKPIFYSTIFLVFLILGYLLVQYLFPLITHKFKRKIKRFFKKK